MRIYQPKEEKLWFLILLGQSAVLFVDIVSSALWKVSSIKSLFSFPKTVLKVCKCPNLVKNGYKLLFRFPLIFGLFKQQYILTINKCEKDPSSIWCWDSNSRPFDNHSPSITTRPGLPPYCKNLFGRYFVIYEDKNFGICLFSDFWMLSRDYVS